MRIISSVLNGLKGSSSSKATPTSSIQNISPAASAPKIDVSQLIADKRKYTDLKTNIESIIRYLNSAIEKLETPSTRIKDLFNIDSVSIDGGRINAIRQDLIERRNYLNNVVLVELDKNVKKINESIG